MAKWCFHNYEGLSHNISRYYKCFTKILKSLLYDGEYKPRHAGVTRDWINKNLYAMIIVRKMIC